jgi:hypothetical protein
LLTAIAATRPQSLTGVVAKLAVILRPFSQRAVFSLAKLLRKVEPIVDEQLFVRIE